MIRFYTATERFCPASEGWVKYFEWAKIPNLQEVVSLDGMLCPPLIPQDFSDVDWEHSVQIDTRIGFSDLPYLLKRIDGRYPRNVLRAVRNPNHLEVIETQSAWSFVGFDLIEDLTGISALVNCGGFPESFKNEELNQFGLISGYERAIEVQAALRRNNPDEPHANCDMYQLWRYQEHEGG